MELIRSGGIGRDYCPYDRLIPIWSGENQSGIQRESKIKEKHRFM